MPLDPGGSGREEKSGALLRAAVEIERLGAAFEQLQTGDGAAVPSTADAARDSDARTADGNKMGKRGKKKTKGRHGLSDAALDFYEPPSIEQLASGVAGAGHVQIASITKKKFGFTALMGCEAEGIEEDDT